MIILVSLAFLYIFIGLLVGGYTMARLEGRYEPDAEWGASMAGVFWPVVVLFVGLSFVVALGKGLYR